MKSYLLSFANRTSALQAIKVGIVGVANTVVSFSLFNVFLALGASWFASVSLAFALTTFMSYIVNRRWTFDLKDNGVSGAETLSFFAVNVVAYVATVAIMWVAETLFGPLTTLGYNTAMVVAAGTLILPKLAGYRDIVFSKALGAGSVVSVGADPVEPAPSEAA